MKTSELTGAALDWAVTLIQKPEACAYGVADWREQRNREVKNGEYLYRWHQSWAQGGPIIEQMHIDLDTYRDGWRAIRYTDKVRGKSIEQTRECGPTPLIAAMRCYVASRLGDDVEIPKELT